MEKNILIINGHPAKESLSKSLAEHYKKSAERFGHKTKIIHLKDLDFDPILHEGYNKDQPLEKDLISSQKYISWANHIVIVYPTWWGNIPSILSGFISRVFLPGFAFKFRKGKLPPEKYLKNKSARLITTTGGPWWVYFIFGHPGNKSLSRFTLKFCGISPVRTTRFSKIRKSLSKEKKEKIFEKVRKLGEKAI